MYAYFICRALHSNNCSSELHYPMILLLVRSAIKWQGSLEVILSILIGWFFPWLGFYHTDHFHKNNLNHI